MAIEQIILVVHLLVALAIIGLVLLQQGKGADMGASFGAGASQTLFGSDGSGNVLTRATTWLVVLFFCTSFGLAMLASRQSASVNELGLELPPSVMEQQAGEAVMDDGELPVVEDDLPAAEPAQDDLPSLD